MGISLILRYAVGVTPRPRRGVRRAAAGAVVLALLAGGCGSTGEGTDGAGLRVVTSAYPIAEVAERVGGGLVEVENLTPPGAEPHDLELAPNDLELLITADVVLFVGGSFQPAVEDAVAEAEGTTLDVLTAVDTLPAVGTYAGEGVVDPHVWLDPIRLAAIADAVAETLGERDPTNAETYRANAEAYAEELTALNAEFRDGLAVCSSRLLVVSHAAFGYLADAYGLMQEPIAGISPETEPDPARLAELLTLVEEEGVTTIFTEDLISPEVAETLADEAGVGTSVLSPLEGLTQVQLDAGEDYGSVMRRNLETLAAALGCA